MKNEYRLPIELSLGMIQCKGTIEKRKGKENQVYFHTILNSPISSENKTAMDADFYPIRIELMNQILIKWECKSNNLTDSLKYPLAAAIEKKLIESEIPLF